MESGGPSNVSAGAHGPGWGLGQSRFALFVKDYLFSASLIFHLKKISVLKFGYFLLVCFFALSSLMHCEAHPVNFFISVIVLFGSRFCLFL